MSPAGDLRLHFAFLFFFFFFHPSPFAHKGNSKPKFNNGTTLPVTGSFTPPTGHHRSFTITAHKTLFLLCFISCSHQDSSMIIIIINCLVSALNRLSIKHQFMPARSDACGEKAMFLMHMCKISTMR